MLSSLRLKSTAASFFRLINPLTIARSIWRQRELIIQLTRREVGQRYRGSYLGMLWSFITPLLMLTVYTVVFSLVFKSQWRANQETSTLEFALILFSGLSAFNLFSEVANRSAVLVLQVPNYVKKVVFPLEILPVVAVATALINSLITVLLVVVGGVVLLGRISATLWFLPLAYVPLLLLCLGLSWLFASLGVFVRDISHGIGVLVQILFFTSGVFFSAENAPGSIRAVLEANPLATILESFRQVLIWGELPDLRLWVLASVGSGCLAILAYAWFVKTKSGFADVL